MSTDEFRATLNAWGHKRVPFLFAIDFEMHQPLAWRLNEIDPAQVAYSLNGVTNAGPIIAGPSIQLKKYPVSKVDYLHRFDIVRRGLEYGDSFLANLTIKTRIELNIGLRDLFDRSNARYKLWLKDQFLVFSPEIFIQIRDHTIFSYPMKGTIDAAIPGAREKILKDSKELSEHVTIVDLIRNDLSIVATQVEVSKFRYIDEIKTNEKTLLQVSSEIKGTLGADYHAQLGDILLALLPAGSVSGAPKTKTVTMIKEAEKEERGYYTGIFGLFDGVTLDSGVMIRFIEQQGSSLYYRSGGGITTQSDFQSEYQEAIDKIYVPVN